MRCALQCALLLGLAAPRLARAQACCAGASALTPARLELHEAALIGVQLQAAAVLGSYDSTGRYRANPEGAAEVDFEQDFFGSLRWGKRGWASRGQASLLIPLVESWRTTVTTGDEFGGGLGDVNLALRYDVVRQRELRYLPGIGVLAGATLPSGRPPEEATKPLGSDATGIGTTQLSAGLALEHAWGPVLWNLTGLASKRLSRQVQGIDSELGTQFDVLLGASYALRDETALALVGAYSWEGNASLNGVESPDSSARRLRVSLVAATALGESFRLRAAVQLDPPVDQLGQNRTASLGALLTTLWTFR
ncbi:MAG TPA: hypothetical protein VLC09_18505 [Polyangiaceae bacterium]|nr:hypothetical protein [Polyangiaceae bacterium]